MNNNDVDVAAQLFALIATEQAVITRLRDETDNLVGIREAKEHLAKMDAATLRAAMEQRHAVLGEGA